LAMLLPSLMGVSSIASVTAQLWHKLTA